MDPFRKDLQSPVKCHSIKIDRKWKNEMVEIKEINKDVSFILK